MERLDNLTIPDRAEEIRCFFCGRNEALRLPEFLEYHRRLGVDRFFFVDNGSTDDSVEVALAEESVHVWRTEQPYQESRFGVDWQEALRRTVRRRALVPPARSGRVLLLSPSAIRDGIYEDFLATLDGAGRACLRQIDDARHVFRSQHRRDQTGFRPEHLRNLSVLRSSAAPLALLQTGLPEAAANLLPGRSESGSSPPPRWSASIHCCGIRKDTRLSSGHHHLHEDVRNLGSGSDRSSSTSSFSARLRGLCTREHRSRMSLERLGGIPDLPRRDRRGSRRLNFHDPRVSIRFRDTDTFHRAWDDSCKRETHRGAAEVMAAALFRRIVK